MMSQWIKQRDRYVILYGLVAIVLVIFSLKKIWGLGVPLVGDSLFHVQRVYEIRYAFLHGELPNWLNFQTFMGVGQAVNGMYPDLTLWPLVLVTMPFSFETQVFLIKLLILILTGLVSYVSLKGRSQLTNRESVYLATAYTCSGYVLYQFIQEFQPGTAIILIFTFPIFFLIQDLLLSQQFNLKLALKFSLCVTLIMASHLLSIVILLFLIMSMGLIQLFRRRLKWAMVLEVLVGGIIASVTSLPILFRYKSISSSGILSPFGQGNIQAAPLKDMFKSIAWDARTSLSILSIIIFLVIFTFLSKNESIKRLWWLVAVECYIFILCTNLFPWKLFNKVPLINNLQYTPWRFGILLAIIPIVMLAMWSSANLTLRRQICFILAIMSMGAACFRIYSLSNQSIYRLNSSTANIMTKVTARYSKSDYALLSSAEKPDYLPRAKGILDSEENLTPFKVASIKDQDITVGRKTVKVKKSIISDGVALEPLQYAVSKSAKMILPILCYRSLGYNVQYNSKPVKYSVNKHGNMVINTTRISPGDKITIKYATPLVYKISLLISGMGLLAIVVLLYRLPR